MTSFLFPNEEALRVALTSGLVPPEVQAAAAVMHRDDDGGVRVTPATPLPDAVAKTLKDAGVTLEPGKPAGAVKIDCWAQAVRPRWFGEPDQVPPLVLFSLPKGARTLDLAAELLRLGCDRQELRFTPNDVEVAAWVRVVGPPYYTLARILDQSAGMRAFVPTPAGQSRVWTELGFEHPLVQVLKPGGKELLLIYGDGRWLRIPDERWTDLYQLVDLALPVASVAVPASPPPERLSVTLRLGWCTPQKQPLLWVLRKDAAREMDALVQSLPDVVAERLLFAASGDTVIVTARAGTETPPELVLPSESYVPLAGFQNLFLPADRLIEPPLRRERLRDLLAPDPERLFWLAPDAEGPAFTLESIARDAFQPLSEWIDYIVHSNAPALEPWVRSATFEFEPYESIGAEWGAAPPEEPPPEPEPRHAQGRQRQSGPETDIRVPAPTRERAAKAPPAPVEALRLTSFSASEEEKRLAAVERTFLESKAPSDDPSRQQLWLEMAQIQTRLGRGREAGLCWTRALWELPADDTSLLGQWLEAEAHLRGTPSTGLAAALLTRTRPSRDETRALTACVVQVAATPGLAGTLDPHAAQIWLDTHDDDLDVRSLWLARVSLARLAGGDQLGLTRAHDRVMARLQRGLSLEREVPAFLRFSSRTTSDLAGAGQLVQTLEKLLKKFESTTRKRSPVEARPELTRAYVRFAFAYGMARLGNAERARSLRTEAVQALEAKDPVHGFLSRAYGARIDQALEALPLGTPLPVPIAAELDKLEPYPRYVVEQIRELSTILEPHESTDAFSGYVRTHAGAGDMRGPEFAGLRGLTDTDQIGREVERLVALAVSATDENRQRLFEGVLDFLPSLPEPRAAAQISILARSLGPFAPAARASVTEKLLRAVGYLGRRDLAEPLITGLAQVLSQLSDAEATQLAQTIGRVLRSLRRVGMHDRAADLVEQLLKRVTGTTHPALVARMHLAGGLASLGRAQEATPIFDATLAMLRGDLESRFRGPLTRAYCLAAAQTNPTFAIERVPPAADKLAVVTDSLGLNQYMCTSVVSLMESLVLGLASEELELGEAGRRWLDDDEYLIRRRVHRELREHG
jgi:hypothetical protein